MLFIDGRFLGKKPTGIGIGLYGLLSKLNIDYKLLLLEDTQLVPDTIKDPIYTDIPLFSLKEQFFIPPIIKDAGCIYIHHFISFVLSKTKTINFIHDLIPFYFPKDYSPFARIYYYLMNYITIRIKAKNIFVNSYETKRDILRHFPLPPDKIKIVGYSSLYKKRVKRDKKGNYFLYVGNEKTHKNTKNIIAAFLDFLKIFPNTRLIIIGEFKNKINHPNILYRGYLSNRELDILYENAKGLLFPSLKEGFGIPILDGNALGVPVVTSSPDPTGYVAGDSTYLCDPYSKESIKDAMCNLIINGAKSKKLVKRGYKNRERFSFYKMAKNIEKELRKCL